MDEMRQRMDLRVGAFACSIQGFDDPAAVLERIISTLRDAADSDPDFAARTAVGLDAETVSRLREAAATASGMPAGSLEAVPGLIVMAPDTQLPAETTAPGDTPADDPAPADQIRDALSAASAIPLGDGGGTVTEDGPRRGWPEGWMSEDTPAAPRSDEALFPEDTLEAAQDGALEPDFEEAEISTPAFAAATETDDAAQTTDNRPFDDDEGPIGTPEVIEFAPEAAPAEEAATEEAESEEAESEAAEDTGPPLADAENPLIARLRRSAEARERGEAQDTTIEAASTAAPTVPAAAEDEARVSPLQRRGRRPRNIFGTTAETPEGSPASTPASEPMVLSLPADPVAGTEGEAPIALDQAMMVDAAPEAPLGAGDEPLSLDAGSIIPADDAPTPPAPESVEEESPPPRKRRRSIFGVFGGGSSSKHEEEEPAPESTRPSRSYLSGDDARRGRPKPPMTAQALSWKMEAHTPDDQLICAGAFLTFVEKKPRYTRRELFAVLDSIPGEVVRNLEVRIRNLGRLTRDGVFVQLDADHFTLSDGELDRLAEYFED
ncbi:MAG: hypothetical protein AAFQ88_04155 [Pseudomonadota bacterium]